MDVTIDLPPELESRLREEALRCGVDAATVVVDALEERLRGRSLESLMQELGIRPSAHG